MSAIDLAAALEAVRLGEATQQHAAVLARAVEALSMGAVLLPSKREADMRAELATVRADNNRLRAVVIAQANAWDEADAWRADKALRDERWQRATDATEALGRELRGAR